MYLSYNGIEMECLELYEDGFLMEAVYDDTGTDYLYTKVSIKGLFLINGQQEIAGFTPFTAYDQSNTQIETLEQLWKRTAPPAMAADPPFAPGPPSVNRGSFGRVGSEGGPFPFNAADGVYAIAAADQQVALVYKSVVPCVQTATTIRSRLQSPRGRLFVYTGAGDVGRKDEILLLSPSWGSHTDCKNGPVPIVHSLQMMAGNARTFIASFVIETYVREMTSLVQSSGSPAPVTAATSPLLSNRFSMRHEIDEDYYTSVAVRGTAIFRTDLLYKDPPINPDQFRLSLFLPVPFGCVRENLQIETLPDGTGVTYSFLDRQQHANFVAGPYANVSQIEAIHRQAIMTDEDILRSALGGFERALTIRANRNIGQR